MNEARFWMFFTLLFDLHNLVKEGKLRSEANPKSPLRWQLLNDIPDYERNLLERNEEKEVNDLEVAMTSMNIEDKSDFVCDICGAKYKKPWTLKSHVIKKHGVKRCDICNETFTDEADLNVHMEVHSLVCSICDKRFPNPFNLKRHMKIHDQVFVCTLCKEVFLDRKSYTAHKKENH